MSVTHVGNRWNIKAIQKCTLTSTVALMMGMAASQAAISADDKEYRFDVPVTTLSEALLEFSEQTNIVVLAADHTLDGIKVSALRGTYSAREAIVRLLQASDVEYEFRNKNSLFIHKKGAQATAETSGYQAIGFTSNSEYEANLGNFIEDTDTDDAEIFEIDEIMVTATKRSVSLQDVSSSITAFGADDIEHRGFDNFEDFARLVPGLTLNQSVRNRGVFNVRGIATNVSGANTQDPVSVYINETPVTDTFGAVSQPDLRLFDVERIEVLRGPQGTLFGSGSLGGTVRIITNKPDPTKVEAKARVDVSVSKGGAWQKHYNGMVNVPLVDDELALRVVGYYRDEEGWVENITTGSKNSTKDWGGRVSMLWQPEDNFSAKIEVIHQDSDPEDGDSWNPAVGKFQKAATVSEERPSVLTNYSLTLDYNMAGFASLISATTYQTSDSAQLQDSGDLFGLGLPFIQQSRPWESKFFTQEVRLVSDTDSAFEWMIGGFFIDRETDVNFFLELPGVNELLGGVLQDDAFFDSQLFLTSQEIAGFADASYKLNEHWKLNAGIRVFETKASYAEPNRRVLNFATNDYVFSSIDNNGTDSNVTWRVGLSYEPTEDALLYASVSKGYRIGQVNPNNGPSFVDPTDLVIQEGFESDSTINYELGAKTSWLDGRLTANLAAFYIDWTNIQIDGVRVSDRRSFVANAGAAKSQGIEFELNALPTDGLSAYMSLTLQDAEITSVPSDIIVPAAVGDKLPGLVDFKIAGGLEYSWDAFTDKRMYVSIDGQYISSSPNSLSNGGANATFINNDAYENIGAAVGLVADQWELVVYGENLTNNDNFILNNGGTSLSPVNTLRPLTIGARVTFSY